MTREEATVAGGRLTAQAAHRLAERLQGEPLAVLYGHGKPIDTAREKVGQVVSWFGPQHTLESELAYIDVAVVSSTAQQALALIEVEESPAPPKLVIGDALAALLGDAVSFRGRSLAVGPWTTLAVLVRGGGQAHATRLAYLADQLKRLQSSLTTHNAAMGRIVVEEWRTPAELEQRLARIVAQARAEPQR